MTFFFIKYDVSKTDVPPTTAVERTNTPFCSLFVVRPLCNSQFLSTVSSWNLRRPTQDHFLNVDKENRCTSKRRNGHSQADLVVKKNKTDMDLIGNVKMGQMWKLKRNLIDFQCGTGTSHVVAIDTHNKLLLDTEWER